jgi:deoxyribodipyrimidine photolyase-related protein
MKSAKLIFPHQLFKDNPLFKVDGNFYLLEELLFFKQYNFHQQKIAFHRATMKCYETFLIAQGFDVEYIESNQPEADSRLLIKYLNSINIQSISIVDPVDDWLLKRIKTECLKFNIQLIVLTSPMFLNSTEDLKHFFKLGKKKFFQTEFYKQQRISKRILINHLDEPSGGKWSFDEDNRKKYPKGKAIVKLDLPAHDKYTEEAKAYTLKYFGKNIGSLTSDNLYPTNFKESQIWLNNFLQTRLLEFGDFEDAIVHKEMLLNHSLLTPMLNIGLLTPAQIVETTLAFATKNNTPINSAEGFIRQIIGWREFIRGVYMAKGSTERSENFWKFDKKIPQSFYNGTTGILPIDETIKKVLKTGYCHHIERLMVLGNFMLLCEFDPDEVYKWFMELFIDAYDWVMVPNVYGMSQFADGGMMATKPYISSSNYLMKMSDYPKGNWQEIWDALFWRFLDKQRLFFLKNPRLGMLVKTFDKWPAEKKTKQLLIAETYLEKLVH